MVTYIENLQNKIEILTKCSVDEITEFFLNLDNE